MVEFVSANPTGPLHVGHGRQAALGDASATCCDARAGRCTREFYYNDAGVQIATLALSVQARLQGLKPGDAGWPEPAYNGDYIADIAADFAARQDGARRRPRASPPAATSTTSTASASSRWPTCATSRTWTCRPSACASTTTSSNRSLYTSGRVDDTVQRLVAAGKTYEEGGALWLRTHRLRRRQGPRDAQVRRQLHLLRARRRLPHRQVRARLHARSSTCRAPTTTARWRACAPACRPPGVGIPAGYPDYVLHKMVTVMKGGEEVKISKRAGSYVTLRDLIDWTSRDAVRFFLISRKADTEFVFDVDLALKASDENPVFYVQYAHARICSVLAQWRSAGRRPGALAQADLSLLTAPTERALMLKLADYPEMLARAAAELAPHDVAFYLRDLAGGLPQLLRGRALPGRRRGAGRAHAWRCWRPRAQVLRNALAVLGVSAPEAMAREAAPAEPAGRLTRMKIAARRLRPRPGRRPAARAGAGAGRGAVHHQGAGALRQQGAAAHGRAGRGRGRAQQATGTRTRRWRPSRRSGASGAAASAAAPLPRGYRAGRATRRAILAGAPAAAPAQRRRPSAAATRRRRTAQPPIRSPIFVQVGAYTPQRGRRAAARQAGAAGPDGHASASASRPGAPSTACALGPVRAHAPRPTACRQRLQDARASTAQSVRVRAALNSADGATPPTPTRRQRSTSRKDYHESARLLDATGRRRPGPGCWPAPARAQGAPVEGTHYVRLAQPAPVTLPSPDKKIEVVEFFWYGCPHCNAFEPALEAWAKQLPADVVLPPGAGGLHGARTRWHQKALLRAGGDGPARRPCTARIFAAIHVQRQRLNTRGRHRRLRRRPTASTAPSSRRPCESFSVNTKASACAAAQRRLQDRRRAGARRARPLLHLGLAGRQQRARAGRGRLPDRSSVRKARLSAAPPARACRPSRVRGPHCRIRRRTALRLECLQVSCRR